MNIGSPEPQLAVHSGLAVESGRDVDDPGIELGHRLAERSPVLLGLVGLVGADQADTAELGHAQHVVPELQIGGADVVGQQSGRGCPSRMNEKSRAANEGSATSAATDCA